MCQNGCAATVQWGAACARHWLRGISVLPGTHVSGEFGASNAGCGNERHKQPGSASHPVVFPSIKRMKMVGWLPNRRNLPAPSQCGWHSRQNWVRPTTGCGHWPILQRDEGGSCGRGDRPPSRRSITTRAGDQLLTAFHSTAAPDQAWNSVTKEWVFNAPAGGLF